MRVRTLHKPVRLGKGGRVKTTLLDLIQKLLEEGEEEIEIKIIILLKSGKYILSGTFAGVRIE